MKTSKTTKKQKKHRSRYITVNKSLPLQGEVRWWFRKSTKELILEIDLDVRDALVGTYRFPAKTIRGTKIAINKYGGELVRDIMQATIPFDN